MKTTRFTQQVKFASVKPYGSKWRRTVDIGSAVQAVWLHWHLCVDGRRMGQSHLQHGVLGGELQSNSNPHAAICYTYCSLIFVFFTSTVCVFFSYAFSSHGHVCYSACTRVFVCVCLANLGNCRTDRPHTPPHNFQIKLQYNHSIKTLILLS